MFDLEQFYKWIPERIIAGAYVCGKWPKEIKLHQEIISQIGLSNINKKLLRLRNNSYQGKIKMLMDAWLMGRKAEKINIVRLRTFFNRITHCEREFKILHKIKIQDYDEDIHGEALEKILNCAKDIVTTKAKVVAVSKILHHLLPNLIVPIDHIYTEKFLRECRDYYKKTVAFNSVLEIKYLTKFFGDIAIHSSMKLTCNKSGKYADTSDTKTIDNWIIMWVDLKLNLS